MAEPKLPEGDGSIHAGLLPPAYEAPPLMVQVDPATVKSLAEVLAPGSGRPISTIDLVAAVVLAVLSWAIGARRTGRARAR